MDYSSLLSADQKRSILEQRIAQFATEAYQHEINKKMAGDNAEAVAAAMAKKDAEHAAAAAKEKEAMTAAFAKEAAAQIKLRGARVVCYWLDNARSNGAPKSHVRLAR